MLIEHILIADEIRKSRSPKELADWVHQVFEALKNSPEATRAFRVRKGPAKRFIEEIYPLHLFASALYGDCPNVTVTPVISNDNFDAVIRDGSSTTKVEITVAIDGRDLMRKMAYLNQHGGVFLTGDIREEGTKKTGRTLVNTPKVLEHSQQMDQQFDLMLEGAKKKAEKTYGKDHTLLISFDASPFLDENYRLVLKKWAQQQLIFLLPRFAAVYLVGSLGEGGIVLHVTETDVMELKHGTAHG